MHEYDIKGSVHSRSGDDKKEKGKVGQQIFPDTDELPIDVSKLNK